MERISNQELGVKISQGLLGEPQECSSIEDMMQGVQEAYNRAIRPQEIFFVPIRGTIPPLKGVSIIEAESFLRMPPQINKFSLNLNPPITTKILEHEGKTYILAYFK